MAITLVAMAAVRFGPLLALGYRGRGERRGHPATGIRAVIHRSTSRLAGWADCSGQKGTYG